MNNDPISLSRPTFLRRCGAIFYDSLITLAVLMLGTWLIMPFTDGQAISPGLIIYQLYLLTLSGFYFVGFWVYCGQTVGMRAWKIKLETEQGGPLSWQQAINRLFWAWVTLLPAGVGLWAALFNSEQRTLYDRFSKTRMVFHKPLSSLPLRERS